MSSLLEPCTSWCALPWRESRAARLTCAGKCDCRSRHRTHGHCYFRSVMHGFKQRQVPRGS